MASFIGPTRRDAQRHKAKRELKKFVDRRISRKAERKDYFNTFGPGNATSTGVIYDLSAVAQGDGPHQRDGIQLSYNSLQLRYIVNGATSGQFNTVRLVVLHWKPDSAGRGDPVPADILQSSYLGTGGAPIAPYVSGANRKDFVVKYDRVISLSSISGADGHSKNVVKTIKLSGKATYQSGGVTGANKVFLLVISGDGVTDYPDINLSYRLSFTDM